MLESQLGQRKISDGERREIKFGMWIIFLVAVILITDLIFKLDYTYVIGAISMVLIVADRLMHGHFHGIPDYVVSYVEDDRFDSSVRKIERR